MQFIALFLRLYSLCNIGCNMDDFNDLARIIKNGRARDQIGPFQGLHLHLKGVGLSPLQQVFQRAGMGRVIPVVENLITLLPSKLVL